MCVAPASANPIAITTGAAITTLTMVRVLFSEPLPSPLIVQPTDRAAPYSPATIGPKCASR
jgi:hypothetical protein